MSIKHEQLGDSGEPEKPTLVPVNDFTRMLFEAVEASGTPQQTAAKLLLLMRIMKENESVRQSLWKILRGHEDYILMRNTAAFIEERIRDLESMNTSRENSAAMEQEIKQQFLDQLVDPNTTYTLGALDMVKVFGANIPFHNIDEVFQTLQSQIGPRISPLLFEEIRRRCVDFEISFGPLDRAGVETLKRGLPSYFITQDDVRCIVLPPLMNKADQNLMIWFEPIHSRSDSSYLARHIPKKALSSEEQEKEKFYAWLQSHGLSLNITDLQDIMMNSTVQSTEGWKKNIYQKYVEERGGAPTIHSEELYRESQVKGVQITSSQDAMALIKNVRERYHDHYIPTIDGKIYELLMSDRGVFLIEH